MSDPPVSILTVLLTAPLTGGLQAGPRFLIPAIPLLCVGLFSFLPKKVKANEIAAISVAALLGFMMLTKGIVMVRNFQLENAEMVGFAETHVAAGEYILTDQNWFPQVAARIWLSRPMAVTQKELELKTAVERLGMIHIRSFWLVQLLYPLTNSPDNAPISPETILSYSRKERVVYKTAKNPVIFSHYFIIRVHSYTK